MLAPGLKANDIAPGDSMPALSATQVTGASHGTVAIASDGGFTYTPTSGFTGTDSFSYRLTGAAITSNTATVAITVAAFAPPKGGSDAYATRSTSRWWLPLRVSAQTTATY